MPDIYLWQVPSDANSNDVRLRDPTTGGGMVYTLIGNAGTYSYTGGSANLVWVINGTAYTLTGDAGTYSYTGGSSNLVVGRNLTANAGSYTYTGGTGNLAVGRALVGNAGVYSLTGGSAVLTLASPVWPSPSVVLIGITYGPNGADYIGTYDPFTIKLDLATGNLVKPISDKLVLTL